MEPARKRELHALGGVDHAVDQVKRRLAFEERHPEITILSPRQTGTPRWRATWTERSGDPEGDGVTGEVTHPALRYLLDYLEARFDRLGRAQ